MAKVWRVARRWRPLVAVAGLVLLVYMGVVHGKGQCAKSDKTRQYDCKGCLYSLSEGLSQSSQLPVKSLVRRENARYSCPREEHSECLHKHLIPKRLYGVFDSVGASQIPDRKFKRLCMRTRFTAVSLSPGWSHQKKIGTQWVHVSTAVSCTAGSCTATNASLWIPSSLQTNLHCFWLVPNINAWPFVSYSHYAYIIYTITASTASQKQ